MSHDAPPPVSKWLQDGFHRFIVPMLRRHFHAIAVDREGLPSLPDSDHVPVIVYANHASWWDPLISHFINRKLIVGRQFYAPIDADALQQYKVFGKLGFYGIESQTSRGAAAFLKQTRSILSQPSTALWITPEGKFTDVRDHTSELMPGLGHLCSGRKTGLVLPLALEYVFWDERLPVCLARFGESIDVADHDGDDKQQWNDLLENRLRHAQVQLAQKSIARCSDPFDHLMAGRSGGGFVYDTFRRGRSLLSGKSFRASHGEQFR